MDPFSAAVGGFQALEGCLGAYQFITDAINIGPDGYRLASRLDWQRFRLMQWGERSGLSINQPSTRIHWDRAVSLLVQQEALLTSAEKLKTKYNLHVGEEEISVQIAGNGTTVSDNEFSRRLRNLRPELKSRIIQGKNSTIKKLKWAGVGRNAMTRIVNDLSEINNCLYDLLDSADKERTRSALDALLRDIIFRCEDVSGIESVQSLLQPQGDESHQALAAAAALKQILLIIGPSRTRDRNVHMSAYPPLRQLHYSRLQLHRAPAALVKNGVEIAHYDGEDVVVEWRLVDKRRWNQLEKAMKRLAFILTTMDKATFHTLPCLGLVASREVGRIGLVYQIPTQRLNSGISRQNTSLYDMLIHCDSVSLSRRIDLATMMAETLLQIHTTSWLHKGIRSENIIFVSSSADSVSQIISSNAYLVGFEYSRPETETFLTEPPTGPLLTDLYRHPDARGFNRQTYARRFDLYSLGCLLLELALWRRLVDIIPISHTVEVAMAIKTVELPCKKADMPSFLGFGSCHRLQELVSYHAGDLFCSAVGLCFNDMNSGIEDSLQVHRKILEALRGCRHCA